tara:strand:+ start:179 stop:1150 length:972 start_codon:yes stop_codon:yes gene_type:complete
MTKLIGKQSKPWEKDYTVNQAPWEKTYEEQRASSVPLLLPQDAPVESSVASTQEVPEESIIGSQVDLKQEVNPVLLELESNELSAYAPVSVKGGEKSGVTIAKGFDLGQRKLFDLQALNLPEPLITKLKPYLWAKGKKAESLVLSKPLTITEDEAKVINDAVFDDELNKLKVNYSKWVGEDFDKLPLNVQQGLLISSFQLGKKLFKTANGKATNFTAQLKDKDWEAAGNNMYNWNNKSGRGLVKRYRAIGDLLSGHIKINEFTSTVNKYYQMLGKPDVSMISLSPEETVAKTQAAITNVPEIPPSDPTSALSTRESIGEIRNA